MFTRAFVEIAGALLMSKRFWAVVFIIFVVGSIIERPVLAIVPAAAILVVWLMSARARNADQQLTFPNGHRTSIRNFNCTGCGKTGKLRLKRPEMLAICGDCGFTEQVATRQV